MRAGMNMLPGGHTSIPLNGPRFITKKTERKKTHKSIFEE
jgi:hypothetical protein